MVQNNNFLNDSSGSNGNPKPLPAEPIDVIYARYSSDMQNPKSCEDQERDVRDGLGRKGFDADTFELLADKAETGTDENRPGFQRFLELRRAKKVRNLAVDDQARFGRMDNAYALIKDLVFDGGRFISTCEGIDTNEKGWELRVKVMELHNSTTIQELGNRVRRGQRARVVRGLSAGDRCFGYDSFYVNPEQAAAYRGVGPKPEKGVRINEEQAAWVRQVFAWFIEPRSIGAIARELTAQKVDKGHRGWKPIWGKNLIRKMLTNRKYVGWWPWGETTTIRNSAGKKKQVPVPLHERVLEERPDLRIIDQETWDKAQARLKLLGEIYGQKDGQKPRGPKVHHTEAYPSDLLGGLVYCGEEKCQSRMWQHSSGKRKYLACPNHGDAEGMCPMHTQVPCGKAETALLGCLAEVFKARPGWIDKALSAMRKLIDDAANRVPKEIEAKQQRVIELRSEANNLARQLAKRESEAMSNYLAEVEGEIRRLDAAIEEGKQLLDANAQMPSDAWIDEQLRDIPGLIRGEVGQAAILLRKLLGNVSAHQVLPAGKKRGYAQLRFRINGWEALRAILPPGNLHTIVDMLANGDEVLVGMSDEFVLDLGGAGRMDRLAPQIAEMRARKVPVTWKRICEITGLKMGPAYVAWKRYVDAKRSASNDDAPAVESDQGGATGAT